MTSTTTWQVTDPAWHQHVAACPDATFFHTRGWYAAQAECMGYTTAPCLVQLADGTEVLVPLATRPCFRGLVRQAHVGIEGGYGGVLAPRPLTDAELARVYRAVHARHRDLVVVGNPHAALPQLPARAPRTGATTQVVPLLPREEQLRRMDESRRKKVRRAQLVGFTLEVIHPVTPVDVTRFFALYAERAADWSSRRWVRDAAYFRALTRHAGDQLALFLVHRGGELAGFQLVGLTGPTVMAMILATARAHEPDQVGAFLAVEPMAWCQERGYTGYDLLASGPLDTVRVYKASLGAETLPYDTATLTGLVSQSMRLAWPWKRQEAPTAS